MTRFLTLGAVAATLFALSLPASANPAQARADGAKATADQTLKTTDLSDQRRRRFVRRYYRGPRYYGAYGPGYYRPAYGYGYGYPGYYRPYYRPAPFPFFPFF